MLIKLKVNEGPRKDDEFSIKGEVLLGRSQSELPLKDPKVSSLHAKITISAAGRFEIVDLNSSNGTFVNDKKILANHELKPGDLIKIGRTIIEVIEISGESPLEPESWQAQVDKALLESFNFYEKMPPKKTTAKCFTKPVCLKISKGEDLGREFVYSFGPRQIGRNNLDGYILNADFPDAAIELIPQGDSCLIIKRSPKVLLNSQPFESQILESGDIISVGQTDFVVKFLDLS